MTTRADVLAEARSWIGTPWQHQGRLKGKSCDCAGLIIKVASALGLMPADFDVNGYPMTPDPRLMRRILEQHCDRIPRPAMRSGDLLFLRPHRLPQHVGFYTDEGTVIHAIDRQRGVREHILNERWENAIVTVYRYRGLED